MPAKAIKVEHLTYFYPDTTRAALQDITFEIDYGEVLGIVGPNNAGKTTLAMCLMGLIPNVIGGELKGSVRVDGVEVPQTTIAEMVRHAGLVFQEPEIQLSQTTVAEEVALGLSNLGIPRDEMLKRIKEALAMVGLSGFEERNPLAMSGGQQQRLAIAAVLAMQPKIMIFDEPTSMLDPAGKTEVFTVLAQLKARKFTGVIIEHEIERVALYCDKVLVLANGEQQAFGTPQEVFSQVEKIKTCGIRPPQVTELAHLLKQDVYPGIDYFLTVEGAVAGLAQYLQGKGHGEG
ncbi:energy-coupling factor ABC transporter ATP-binding protein [Moorella sp. ACPs]|uniref:energy-coupling factor ABC transporter ATP-binding protein n=1 Tax=Neomoorella carbonis TaxID=3062783 RepID=UPI00324FDA3F